MKEQKSKAAKPSSLSQKAGIIVLSRVITSISWIGSMAVLVRLLSKTEYGLLSFLILSYSTVVTLAQLGLPESIFYFFERISEAARKTLTLLMARMLIGLGLAASVVFVVLTFVAPAWGFQVKGLYTPLIVLILLDIPTIMMPNVLIALDRAKEAAWLNIAGGISQFAALIIPAWLGQSVDVIIFSFVGYGVVRFALSAFLFGKNFKQKGDSLPAGMARELLRYSVPLAAAQILWGLNKQVDKYVVAAFLPVTVYAVYTNGSWEIPIIPTIAFSVASVMMPSMVNYFSKGETTALLALWNKAIKKVSLIVLPLTCLLELIAEEFIVLMFSADYIEAAIPFRIYTLIILHRVAAYTSLLRAIGDTKSITRSAVLLLTVNIVLNFPLVLAFGLAGPAIATLLANLVTWFYVLKVISKQLRVSLSEIFPGAFYIKALLIAAAPAIVLHVLGNSVEAAALPSLLWKLLSYLVLFGILGTLTGLLTRTDWQYLVGWVTGTKTRA